MGKMELKRNILEYEKSTVEGFWVATTFNSAILEGGQNENGEKTILKGHRKKTKTNTIVFKTASGETWFLHPSWANWI